MSPGLCVNREADVQTTRQTAMVDSELCLGLRVSLLTANWHPAPTNKVHHPYPTETACSLCLLCVRVCVCVCVCVWPAGAGYSWKATDERH